MNDSITHLTRNEVRVLRHLTECRPPAVFDGQFWIPYVCEDGVPVLHTIDPWEPMMREIEIFYSQFAVDGWRFRTNKKHHRAVLALHAKGLVELAPAHPKHGYWCMYACNGSWFRKEFWIPSAAGMAYLHLIDTITMTDENLAPASG